MKGVAAEYLHRNIFSCCFDPIICIPWYSYSVLKYYMS